MRTTDSEHDHASCKVLDGGCSLVAGYRAVVAAALRLDRRSHQWSEWYRQTYHFTPTTDSPEWDEFDAALTAVVKATDILSLQYVHYPKKTTDAMEGKS